MTGQNLCTPQPQFYRTLQRVAQLSDFLAETARSQREERGAPPQALPKPSAEVPTLSAVVDRVFDAANWIARTPSVRPFENDGGGGGGDGGEGGDGGSGESDVALVASDDSSTETLTVQQDQTHDAINDLGTVTQGFVDSNDKSERESSSSDDPDSDTVSSSATPIDAVSGTKTEPTKADVDRQKDSQNFGADSKSMFIEPQKSAWNATGLASDNLPHEEPGVRAADEFFGFVSSAVEVGNISSIAREAARIGNGVSPIMKSVSLGMAVHEAAGRESVAEGGLAFAYGYVAGYAGEVVAVGVVTALTVLAVPPAAAAAGGAVAGGAVFLGITYAKEIVGAIDDASMKLAEEVYGYLDAEIRKLYPHP